ncbi:sodium-translocating pyrophosphatase [bacterium CPR1]|nr:sodium-translocating pyrophosphatase [bacterium CPR1]
MKTVLRKLTGLGRYWMLVALMTLIQLPAWASETDIKVPGELKTQTFDSLGGVSGQLLLMIGIGVCLIGMAFSLIQAKAIKEMQVHQSMAEMSELIYATCRAYLLQQGRFLAILEVMIGICIIYYFGFLRHLGAGQVAVILFASVVGILGSYAVAWFGIRINTWANSRTAFGSLKGKPFPCYAIPLQAGMSIGLMLICVELLVMLIILLFIPGEWAGPCFIGFAIGESLGASALRICGGIFTKIADIGADLMKIVFNIKEDDARNPGVIADCTGDNAGDSVGPTADGFETYGVTGVALIVFITLAVGSIPLQATLLVWIFVMRVLMVITSMASYTINDVMAKGKYQNADKMDFEAPLTNLVWLTSAVSIAVTFLVSKLMLGGLAVDTDLWWKLSVIISCGTLSAAIIPELTKIFTSAKSGHVAEIVDSSKEGGASLTILSGMVAGNYSAFWMGLTMMFLMAIAYATSLGLSPEMIKFAPVFAFGLVAFGMLGMGPVTIAVDSYGPVTDNAQSIYELSLIETIPDVENELQKDYGFRPEFAQAKHFLEENDGAGNTFKATAKPVLIGTAVVGATTMIFSIILLLTQGGTTGMEKLALVDPMILLGLMTGGAVIYWFCGASMQAVTTGAYRAVEYIKANIKLEGSTKASVEDSTNVVRICTVYAQAGMWNIFFAVLTLTLAFAFFNPYFFVAYLVSIALFGLYQAIYMANAGGSWDNAKKVVEVELHAKNTPLHEATIVGDTVGDPYKDTSSVALNPIIKFTTLFGLLAVEIALEMTEGPKVGLAALFLLVGLYFVWRSFYGMRIHAGGSGGFRGQITQADATSRTAAPAQKPAPTPAVEEKTAEPASSEVSS